MPESGEESWGYFDSDKEAIAMFVATYKERKKFSKKSGKKLDDWERKRCLEKGKKFRRIGVLKIRWKWVIQRLGYMKPGVAINDVNIPWKTIYIIECSDDF